MLSHDEVTARPTQPTRPTPATRAPPPPRRHQRRDRPRLPPRTRRSCTGARSSSTRPTQTLARLAVAARPQRVSGGLDEPAATALVATPAGGWLGTPGLEGHRDGPSFSVRLEVVGVQAERPPRARCRSSTREARLAAQLELRVGTSRAAPPAHHAAQHRRHPVHRAVPARSRSPCPWDATEMLDTTGRHLRERSPQRHAFSFGTHLRESRRGRPGADATLLLAAGRPGFGFERGRVHAVHVAWSGNHRVVAERSSTGEAFLAGGELLAPGEVVLAPGESCTSPVGHRLVGRRAQPSSSHRFHDEWRGAPAASPPAAPDHAQHVGGRLLRPLRSTS